MKFVDEVIITVRAGDGGNGCVSFRRERFIPRGGPNGGKGGKGGDVIFKASSGKGTLNQFRYKKKISAQNGASGQGNNKTGKNGNDVLIEIPPGTIITNAETGSLLKDVIKNDEQFIVAYGGRGGQGNAHFKTSTNKTPRFAQNGEPGTTLSLKLELKLIADVGIIGLPNAGKSTLISAISSAHPKIADYPFTTLTPALGVVKTEWKPPFVVADIPGLIEGAHEGAGLGIQFLKHIERTRILIHLIDASQINAEKLLDSYNAICNELVMFDKKLMEKPQLVVLNKIDLPSALEGTIMFKNTFKDKDVLCISALSKKGLDKLISKLVHMLDNSNDV